ncbi:competence/damage-inducible protein A [Romboutsia sp.]|uniref:competence/damage-inducible protein A n=1 Tax=Romboutsia sp. TaxID=1965302 RepID=UPI003F3C3341
MKAEIITVGTEILLGDIVNTNSQYLAKELASLGIDVYYQSSVGDNENRLLQSFKESLKRSDIVITTGGLGPTNDDITKEVACKYFDKELELHKPSWDKIEFFFNKLGIEITENNKKQAYFPKDSIILQNKNGTAPGVVLEKNEKIIIVLPGPPKEMKSMFENEVKPYLQKLTDSVLVSKTLRAFGIGESTLEDKIIDLIQNQTNPTIAPYVGDMEVRLRVMAKAKTEKEGQELIEPVVKNIKDRVGQYIYAEGDTSIEEVVSKMLVEKNMTIATAESCTGGLVSATLINYPGISSVFMEGCVTYSNEAKIMRLGVKEETLEKYGAVSEETAREMAEGIARNFDTNIGLSTTGVAGPEGGTKEKPVGLVYVGIYINGKTTVKKYAFNGDRQGIRLRATKNLLNDLRVQLLEL